MRRTEGEDTPSWDAAAAVVAGVLCSGTFLKF